MTEEHHEPEPKPKLPVGQHNSKDFMAWNQKGTINGLLAPGMKPMVHPLPDGVTLADDPIDRESYRNSLNAVRVPTELPSTIPYVMRAYEMFRDTYPKIHTGFPYVVRQFLNSMSLFKTEPRFHLPPREFVPIWECATSDTVCSDLASQMAARERKIDYNICKVLFQRVRHCKSNESARIMKYEATSYGIEYFCGDIMEAANESYAAYMLKWNDLELSRPVFDLGTQALFKQKNRYIEDRFRKRMMANVGATPHATTNSDTAMKIVDGTWDQMTDFQVEYPVTSFKYWMDTVDKREKSTFDMNKARLIERQKNKDE